MGYESRKIKWEERKDKIIGQKLQRRCNSSQKGQNRDGRGSPNKTKPKI